MANGPNAQEVYERFIANSIYNGNRDDFCIFPDDHPTTWIVCLVKDGQLLIHAFYPAEFTTCGFDDFEEFQMTPQELMSHFRLGDYAMDELTEFYNRKGIPYGHKATGDGLHCH